MEAKLLREKSINSVKAELETIEKDMMAVANKGELKLYVKKISPAAKEYLKGKGYQIKISITEEHKDWWVIEW